MRVTTASPSSARDARGPRPRRAPKRLRATALVAATALVVGSALAGTAAGTPYPCAAARPVYGDWQTIPVSFSGGSPALVDYAVDAADPGRMLATNGTQVAYSLDSGCTWKTSLDLSQPQGAGVDDLSISARALEFGPYGRGSGMLLVDDELPVHHPAVLITSDGGESWRNWSPPLAQVRGAPLSFALGGGHFYVLVDRSEGLDGVVKVSPPHRLYVSNDNGQSWQEGAQEPPGTNATIGDLPPIGADDPDTSTLDALEASETGSDDLWLYGEAGLYLSQDAGVTAKPRDTGFDPPPVGLTEDHALSNGSLVSVYSPSRPTAVRSAYGSGFVPYQLPTVVDSASFPIIAGPEGVYKETVDAGLQATGASTIELATHPKFLDISPKDGRRIYDVDAVAGMTDVVYGRTEAAIVRYDGAAPPPPPPTHISLPTLGDFDVNAIHQPKLAGTRDKLVLHEGEKKSVRYTLVLPPTPTPLDVFFLFDASGSMQDAIDGVKAATVDIINNLRSAGIDVWFGVGEYRSYEAPPAYKRVLDISPPGEPLQTALRRLYANDGGEETQLAALYQVATGAGQHGSGITTPIAPHQNANPRAGSLRVIVHVTDEEFSEGAPHPTYDKVISALNSKDFLQVGLDVHEPEDDGNIFDIITGNNNNGTANSDPGPGLRKVAQGTGTLAPPGGVDCNGDHLPDLFYEQPLVCPIDPEHAREGGVMSQAIVNTLKAIDDVGAVGLEVEGNRHVVPVVDPGKPELLDFKQRHVLTYRVTYRCSHLDATGVYPMTVNAAREAGPLAGTKTEITCKVPGDPPPKKDRPVPVVQLLAPLVPALPIPPAPPEVGTNPNPNPQPNPQAQAQAQGAMATQEEEQPQLAYAHNTSRQPEAATADHDEDKFAFARYRPRSHELPLDPVFVLAAAAMTCAAGAALVRRRTQPSPAFNRRRTHPIRRTYGRGN